MTKILFFFFFSCISVYAVDWISYKEALELQKKNHKIIMIDVVKPDCRYCSNMETQVFDDLYMEEWLEERFIMVKMNLYTETLPLGIKPIVTPSFYFVNHKQEIVKNINGSWNIQDFKDLTENIK